MLFSACSALVATACVVASGWRLAWAVAPVDLDPRLVARALEGDGALALCRSLQRELGSSTVPQRFAWERELLAAFDESEGRARDARINEELIELEGRAQRWARVPRVCASIGTSAGLLFALVSLLQDLSVPDGEGAAGMSAIGGALSSALGALSLGIAATSFCVAVHVRAAAVARERRAAIDALVEKLERLRSMSDGQGWGA